MTASVDDPVASASEQFALSRSGQDLPSRDMPSSVGVRP